MRTFKSLRASTRAADPTALEPAGTAGRAQPGDHRASSAGSRPCETGETGEGAAASAGARWGAGAGLEPARRGGADSRGSLAGQLRTALRGAWERVRADRSLQVLLGLLAGGLALRIWLSLAWVPAFTGYSDSGIYFEDAYGSLWSDPIRTQGYSMFLKAMHALAPYLAPAIYVQELAGLLAVVVVYLAVRRCGGQRWLGLLPAGALALAGDEIVLEHAALSDSLFIFLLIVMIYCALRAAFSDSLRWAVLTGLVAGIGVWERGAGSVMIAVIALWLLFARGRPRGRTLALALTACLVSVAVVGVYVGWRKLESNMPGLLTSNNAWNFYARAAPWANCADFTPPPGTSGLCEYVPPNKRRLHGGGEYIYSPSSPAQILFGPPYRLSKYPHAMELMQEWTEAAILGEPLEYLHAVGLDLLRLFDPNHFAYSDMSANELMNWLRYGPSEHPPSRNEFVEYWQRELYPSEGPPHYGDVAPLFAWERLTRLDGVLMGLLLALTLVAPLVLGGRVRARAPRLRAGASLFALSALAMLLFPILVKGYDYRFVIPAYAPLLAAATMSAWGCAVRVGEWRAHHSSLARAA